MAKRQTLVDKNFWYQQIKNVVVHHMDELEVKNLINPLPGQIMYYVGVSGGDAGDNNGLYKDTFYFWGLRDPRVDTSDGYGWISIRTFIESENDILEVVFEDGIWKLTVVEANIQHKNINLNSGDPDNPHTVTLEQAVTAGKGTVDPDKNRAPAGGIIGLLSDGLIDSDAVNLGQLNAHGTVGMRWTDPVMAATTASITLTGIQTIDDVNLVVGDRVLVKDQPPDATGGHELNGIYIVQTTGWTRATDMDAPDECEHLSCLVIHGTVNVGSGFSQINEVVNLNPPISPGDPLKWVKVTQGVSATEAGDGLTETGNTIDVGAGWGIDLRPDFVDVDPDDFAGKGLISRLPNASKPEEIFIDAEPDGTHLGFTDTTNAAKLVILDKGVTKEKINIDVAGDGIKGGNSLVGAVGAEDPLAVEPYNIVDDNIYPVIVDVNGVGVGIDNDSIKVKTITHTKGTPLKVLYASAGSIGATQKARIFIGDLDPSDADGGMREYNHGLNTIDVTAQAWIQVDAIPTGTPTGETLPYASNLEMIDLDIRIVHPNVIRVTTNVHITSAHKGQIVVIG